MLLSAAKYNKLRVLIEVNKNILAENVTLNMSTMCMSMHMARSKAFLNTIKSAYKGPTYKELRL